MRQLLYQHCPLIFKNINACNIENTEDPIYIRLYIEKILREIGLDPDIEKIEVVNVNKGEGQAVNETDSDRKQQTLVIAVYLRNIEDRRNVLLNKKKLRHIESFSYIYVEIDKTKHERQTEANLRKLVKTVPSLEMRGDRVVNVPDQTQNTVKTVNQNNGSS